MNNMEQPLYGGARMNGASSIPAPVPTQDVSSKHVQRALSNAQDFVSDIANQYQRMKDFGEDAKMEDGLRKLSGKFEEDMTKKLGYARGHEFSFYNLDGSLRKSSLDTFVSNYEGKFRGLKGTFVSQEAAARFGAKQQAVMQELKQRAGAMLLKGQVQESRQAFEEALKGDLGRNDFSSAIDRYAKAAAAGVISQTAASSSIFQMNKKQALFDFGNIKAKDPRQAYDILGSEQYKNLFAPCELSEMRRNLASQVRPAAADSFARSFVLTKKEGEKDNGPEWTGFYTEKECRWIHAVKAGKGEKVRPEVEAAAIEEARAFNPSLSNENMEQTRAAYISKYSRFEKLGIDKDFLNRQWKAAEKARESLKTPTIDIKGRLDLLEKRGRLLNQSAFDADNQHYSDANGWSLNGKFRDEFSGQLNLPTTDSKESAMSKYMAYARASHAAGLRSQISERFGSWRDNEGKDATQAEQQAKLIDVTREITGNKDISFVDEGANQMDSNIANSVNAQRSRFAQWAYKNMRKYWVDSSSFEPPMQRVSLSFDSAQKDLPAGILLPKSMMEEFDQENGVVEATFDNKHFRRFRVVGTCDGDSPQMTYAVARDGFYDDTSSHKVDMRIITGNADQLMKQQEAALPAGKAVKTDDSKLGGLAPYKQAFIDAGKKYGMTPDQVKIGISIAMHETGQGSSSAFRNKNNAMGISPNGGGPRSFESVEAGIDYGMRNLKKNYFDKGLTTFDQIGAVYAPIGANNDPDNLNRHWVTGARKSYNSI